MKKQKKDSKYKHFIQIIGYFQKNIWKLLNKNIYNFKYF